MTAYDPAATMRHAADLLRDPAIRNGSALEARLADWLDSAALDAEAIGPNPHAERVAAAVLGLDDPWPGAKRPHRPAT